MAKKIKASKRSSRNTLRGRMNFKFSKIRLAIVLLIFATIGSIAVYRSFASTDSSIYIGTSTYGLDGNGQSVVRHDVRIMQPDGSGSRVSFLGSSSTSFPLSLSRTKTKLVGRPGGYLSSEANILRTADVSVLSKAKFGNLLIFELEWRTGDSGFIFNARAKDAKDAYNEDIYTSNLDGTNLKKIAMHDPKLPEDSLYCPSLQPQQNGNKIAYLHRANPRFGDGLMDYIRVMNSDGSANKVVAQADALSCPVWSPDGKKLAYNIITNGSSPAGENQAVLVVNADGTGNTLVTTGVTGSPLPYSTYMKRLNVWSPGLTSILVKRMENKVENLYYVNISTKVLTKITQNTSPDTKFREFGWTDKGKIVYAYHNGTDNKSYVKSVNSNLSGGKVIYTTPANTSISDIEF